MDNLKPNNKQETKIFPATVVKIIDPFRIVINRGAAHGIKDGQRFLLYKLSSEEIKDPVSSESLGYLEIPKGTGKVIHIQEQMSTIESYGTKPSEQTIVRRRPISLLNIEETITTPPSRIVPFDSPEIGDKVKPI